LLFLDNFNDDNADAANNDKVVTKLKAKLLVLETPLTVLCELAISPFKTDPFALSLVIEDVPAAVGVAVVPVETVPAAVGVAAVPVEAVPVEVVPVAAGTVVAGVNVAACVPVEAGTVVAGVNVAACVPVAACCAGICLCLSLCPMLFTFVEL